MLRAMNRWTSRHTLAIALSACLGIWLSSATSARAQDTATEPQTETASESQTETAADAQNEPKLRKRLIDSASEAEEWNPEYRADPELEMRDMLAQADRAYANGRIIEDTDGALDIYLRVLRRDSGNAAARAGVSRSVAWIVQRGETAIASGNFDTASRYSAIASRHQPSEPTVQALAAKISAGRELAVLLSSAQQLAEQGRLVEPAGNNALDAYRAVLDKDGNNATALAGVASVQSALVAQALNAAQSNEFARADQLLGQADSVAPGNQAVQDAGVRVTELRGARAAALEQQINTAIESSQFDDADSLLAQLDATSLQPQKVEELREQIYNARTYASLKPGQRITDPLASGGNGPELVVIPLGSFTMGSPKREKDRSDNEGPQIEVKFKRAFAMAATEVTVAEFRRFVTQSGYSPTSTQTRKSTIYDENTGTLADRNGVTWEDDHSGSKASDNLPVIHVSWLDTQAYVQWLSRETGKRYRLPSEAEFEYVLRAGSNTAYPWGDGNPAKAIANVTGSRDRSASKRNWVNSFKGYDDGYWGPAPVRSFEPNRFGLYDTIGNVSEWTEDCWHDSYQRAPTDGSAWVNAGCNTRMLRGASWASAPDQVRSAFRLGAAPNTVDARLGFRVVREL